MTTKPVEQMNEHQAAAHGCGYWQLTNPLNRRWAEDMRFLGSVLTDMERGRVTYRVIPVTTSSGECLEVWRKGGVPIGEE